MSAEQLPALMDGANLILYDQACRALAQAKSVDEVQRIRDKSEAIRQCARVAKNRQMEIDAAEIRMRAERRLGEFIHSGKQAGQIAEGRPAKNGSDGDPFPRVTLEQAGIGKHLADRARKYAAVPEEQFEDLLDAWKGRLEEEASRVSVDLLNPGNHFRISQRGYGSYSSTEWYTPAEYLDLARQVLGSIDLDPASSDLAQQRVKASRYFTIDDDGLAHDWGGRVWLNPPYSSSVVDAFVQKLLEELDAGRTIEAILLTNCYSDTAWWHRAAASCAALCLTKGRIYFNRPNGEPPTQPSFGSSFFYHGRQVDRFRAAFAGYGLIMLPIGAPS